MSLGNRKKSQETRSGKKGGCGSSTTFFCFRYLRTMAALCDEALLCNNLKPRRPAAGGQFKKYFFNLFPTNLALFVCVEVLRPSQPNGVMSSAVSLPNHTFTGQA